ncbi:MAG: AAA family ATPase [Acidimicrobiales bacterium]
MSQLSAPPTEPAGGDPAPALELARDLCATVGAAVRGKDDVVRLSVAALLAGGHLLLEDLPGTGKTLLAKSLATAIGGHFGRVQCTPGPCPATSPARRSPSPRDSSWTFRPGPVFANVVLVDEINRASPRTQAPCSNPWRSTRSASTKRHPRPPSPFFCIATQNPFG